MCGLIKSETLLPLEYTNTWEMSDLNVCNRESTGHFSFRKAVCVKPFPDAGENKKSLLEEERECLVKNAAVIHHLGKLIWVCHVERGRCCFRASRGYCCARNVQVVGTVQERLRVKQQFLECSYKRYVSVQPCLLFRRLKASKYGDCSKSISPAWFKKTYLHALQDFTVTIHASDGRCSQAYLQNHLTEIVRDW